MNTAAAIQMPALNGEVVTEAHARICAKRGHATHTLGGVDQGVCPRCGEVTTDNEATFAKVYDFEQAVRFSRIAAAFNTAGVSDFRKGQQATSAAADQARLDAAIAALTPAQMRAYGAYRAEMLRG